ncbi:MAG: glutamine--fructose-6-phosphate aminotransferase [Clostridiales bacterium]|nr:MAG: glutamine--fructose-6-phosphate aminotransferase [Clostridiales bacterium]
MTLMQKEIFEQPEALKNCLSYNKETFEKLVADIKKAGITNVVIAARGTSDHAGIYGKYLIESYVGVPVGLSAPSAVTLYGGNIRYNNMLVIGISQSGKAADVLAVMDQAKKNGALTCTITNTEDSPLAECADYHLFCNAGLESSVAATKTFGTQLYIMAHLALMWAGRDDMVKMLEEVPAKMQQVIEDNDKVKALATRARFMTDCFILSRGITYPMALEAALKVQETNYVRAKAYPISDFHHGPFAMVDDGTPVFVYAGSGEQTQKDSLEMIEKLHNVGADVLVVSANDKLLEAGDVSFKIPNSGDNDFMDMFSFAVFGQLFACNLAAVKGRNPDAPRGLKKVTITK